MSSQGGYWFFDSGILRGINWLAQGCSSLEARKRFLVFH